MPAHFFSNISDKASPTPPGSGNEMKPPGPLNLRLSLPTPRHSPPLPGPAFPPSVSQEGSPWNGSHSLYCRWCFCHSSRGAGGCGGAHCIFPQWLGDAGTRIPSRSPEAAWRLYLRPWAFSKFSRHPPLWHHWAALQEELRFPSVLDIRPGIGPRSPELILCMYLFFPEVISNCSVLWKTSNMPTGCPQTHQ